MDEQQQTGNGTTERTRGTVTRNPRTVAITKISNLIDELPDDESRERVVRYLAEEYARFLS